MKTQSRFWLSQHMRSFSKFFWKEVLRFFCILLMAYLSPSRKYLLISYGCTITVVMIVGLRTFPYKVHTNYRKRARIYKTSHFRLILVLFLSFPKFLSAMFQFFFTCTDACIQVAIGSIWRINLRTLKIQKNNAEKWS